MLSIKIRVFNSKRFELTEKKSWKIGKLRQSLAEQDGHIQTATEALRRVQDTLNAINAERSSVLKQLSDLESN